MIGAVEYSHNNACFFVFILPITLNAGLMEFGSAVPSSIMSSQISRHITRNGENSMFVRVGRSKYALKELENGDTPLQPNGRDAAALNDGTTAAVAEETETNKAPESVPTVEPVP